MSISPPAHTSALSDLPPGETATVASLSADDTALHQRLLALGLRTGKQVQVMRSAPFSGPLQVRVGATDILIRRRDAAHIQVIRR